MENKDLKNIDTTAKFSNFQVLNPDFVRCKCNVMYTGKNRNYTDITDEALQRFIERKGYANVPVIGHIKSSNKNGKPIMGSHDRKIEITNDGIQEINECTAYGVIPLDANPRMEKIIDVHGIEKEYFTVDVILWTHYFPELMETAYSDEVYFNQSMEITLLDFDIQDQYTVINDFSLQALCMLGKYDCSHGNGDESDTSEPCFEDSRIRRFSLDEDKFKQNFELMLDKLKQYESATAVHDKETNNKPNKEEKKFMDLEKLNAFLSTFTFKDNCDNDVAKYALLGDATETSFTVIDREDNFKVYTVEFALDDEQNIVADWDAKVEKKFAIVNADEESAIDLNTVIGEYAQSRADMITESLTVSFNEKIDEMAKEYEDLSKELETSNKKLADFEAEKAEADRLAHKAEVDAVVAEFAKKIGRSPKFLVYKAKLNADEVTVEKVTQDLTLMAGQEMIGGKSASYSYQPTETKVANKENNDVQNRYGNLLSKYMK